MLGFFTIPLFVKIYKAWMETRTDARDFQMIILLYFLLVLRMKLISIAQYVCLWLQKKFLWNVNWYQSKDNLKTGRITIFFATSNNKLKWLDMRLVLLKLKHDGLVFSVYLFQMHLLLCFVFFYSIRSTSCRGIILMNKKLSWKFC